MRDAPRQGGTSGGTDKSYNFGYDPSGRLDSATYPPSLGLPFVPEVFDYDDAGNRNDGGTPWIYNENDELMATRSTLELCYDDDGNLTEKRSAGACGERAGNPGETNPDELWTWDETYRLKGWTDFTATGEYLTDPFGRRIRKTVDADGGGAAHGPETTWNLWDGDRLVADYDDSGT